jgi:phytoene dehydrogenase-like protein
MSASARGGAPVVVVGAGVAGLCCALHLGARGLPVALLEAGDAPGGRVRSDVVDDFRVDRGFQILLTAYPEARAMLDFDALRLGRFAPGAMIWTGTRMATVADPFRRPRDVLRTLRAGVSSPRDALRIACLLRRVRRGPAEALLTGRSIPAADALRDEQFSEQLIERFFRPFLGGVFLDRELRASSRALDYLLRMFASGDAALPAEGIGAIPRQLAERLLPGVLRMRARVAAIEADAVALASGERIRARAVVVATDARAAAQLVPGLAVPASNPACTLSFAAARAPALGGFLGLDGTGEGPVNEICVPSAIAPDYAPPGRHLISASVLAPWLAADDASLEASAREQLGAWFGPAVASWQLLRIDRIPDALPAQPPGAFEPEARDPRLGPRLYVCGDHRALASLQGAMESGRRAAEAVAGALA